MPEHQIVINLKREQFEEVQRLSRLAGSKSVSAFIKDRVLALLGVEGETLERTQLHEPTAEQIQDISHELSRLHRELQAFIAESLNSSTTGEAEDDSPFFHGDLTEQAYEAYLSLQHAINEELYGNTTGGAYQTEEAADNISIYSQISAMTNSQTMDSDNGGQAGIYSDTPAESIFMPQQSAFSAKPNDDLEDLAERAFAISPRLGTAPHGPTQSHGLRKPQTDDPLQDLIDDSIIEQAEKQRIAQTGGSAPPADPYQSGIVYAFDEPSVALPSEPLTTVEEQPTGSEFNSYEIPPDELIAPSTDPEEGKLNETPPAPAVVLEQEQGSTDDSSPEEEVEESSYTVYSPPADETANTPSYQQTSINTTADDENATLPATSTLPPDPYFIAGPPPKRKRPVDSEDDSGTDERISGGPPPKRRKK